MSPLDKKLFRDLGRMKGQMAAVIVVMACGLMVMVMERGLVRSLEYSKSEYYSRHRLADVFCELRRAPNFLRATLSHISGTAAVETRVLGVATLDIPGMEEPAQATLVSIPDDHPPRLNLLYLRSGRLPLPGRRGEVVVSDAFAQEHGFRPGDTIDATILGARVRLQIVATALSPEFVYELPPGGIMPDNRRFGILWMGERELAAALGLKGGFNSVVVDVSPYGDIRAVKSELERILAPYGARTAYGRREHPSVNMVDEEIRGLRATAVAFPLVFLSIAAFMTSAALTRLVRLQREQIGQLKALGYSSREIGWHYTKFALVAVVLGTGIGGALGLWAGSKLVLLYHPFFRFPSLTFHPEWPSLFVGLLASGATSLAGVATGVRHAVVLSPATAMRPEPPGEFRRPVVRFPQLQRLAPPSFRMAVRNLRRKPWQATFTGLGLAFATAIPVVSVAMDDGIKYMMNFQWRLAQRQDVTVSLVEPGSHRAMTELAALPGVLYAEPFRAVPARIVAGHRERQLAVTGLARTARLSRLLDEEANPIGLPRGGLALSEQLAQTLHVGRGDTLRIEVQEGTRPVFTVVVAALLTDFAGVGAYMDIEALRRRMGEGNTVSGAHLELDGNRWTGFFAAVKRSPRVASVATTRSIRETYDRMMGDMMDVTKVIMSLFAVVLSFGVIYNGARIALSERTRDLAALRVLGFTRNEVAAVLVGELAILTVLALIPGLFLGNQLTRLILASTVTETMRIPVLVTSRAYATAATVVLVSSFVSFGVVSRRIVRLDLLGVLKARE